MLADSGKASSFFSIWMEKMRPEIGTVRHHSENFGKKITSLQKKLPMIYVTQA